VQMNANQVQLLRTPLTESRCLFRLGTGKKISRRGRFGSIDNDTFLGTLVHKQAGRERVFGGLLKAMLPAGHTNIAPADALDSCRAFERWPTAGGGGSDRFLGSHLCASKQQHRAIRAAEGAACPGQRRRGHMLACKS